MERNTLFAKHSVDQLLEKHSELFHTDLGTLQGHKVSFHVDLIAKSIFCKAISLPYAYRVKVEEELERLVKTGILKPVEFTDWASPIVAVLKRHNSICICGDFKQTINPVSKKDRYPIPKVEDLFVSLNLEVKSSQTLISVRLTNTYQLTTNLKQFIVINTHKGLYCYTRLPYGYRLHLEYSRE